MVSRRSLGSPPTTQRQLCSWADLQPCWPLSTLHGRPHRHWSVGPMGFPPGSVDVVLLKRRSFLVYLSLAAAEPTGNASVVNRSSRDDGK